MIKLEPFLKVEGRRYQPSVRIRTKHQARTEAVTFKVAEMVVSRISGRPWTVYFQSLEDQGLVWLDLDLKDLGVATKILRGVADDFAKVRNAPAARREA